MLKLFQNWAIDVDIVYSLSSTLILWTMCVNQADFIHQNSFINNLFTNLSKVHIL